jgi:ABC-type antimicrobial peptide transport system permease subunit
VGSLLDGYSVLGGARIRAGQQGLRLLPAQVTPGYFEVVGTRVLAGRPFEPGDRGWSAIVINEAFAALAWPETPLHDIVGRPISINDSAGHVVGIVENARDRSLDRPPMIRMYRPLELGDRATRRVNYAIHLVGSDAPTAAIQRAVVSVIPGAVIESVDSIDGRLAETVRDRSFATLVLTLFAAAGVGVTALGIFAVVAFVVARRTREIGIRVALGAQPRHVRQLVVSDAATATLVGALAGWLIGRWGVRTLQSQLYGVAASDVMVPGLAGFMMLAIAAFAAWWPSRRALRLDPTRALRIE